jgi:HPt (histidine-containing phosphotransfer) domain-containing protein
MTDLQWNRSFAFEQSGEDVELLRELLDLLKSSSLSDFEKIKEGLAADDGEAVADAAHSIKGAAASLGVEGLRTVAHAIEKKGRAGQHLDIDVAELEYLIGQLDTIVA